MDNYGKWIVPGIIVAGLLLVLWWKGGINLGGKPSVPAERSYSKPEVEVMKELSRQEERAKVLYEQQYGK